MRIYFEPKDIWVGVYVGPDAVYICQLPMLVIKLPRRPKMGLGILGGFEVDIKGGHNLVRCGRAGLHKYCPACNPDGCPCTDGEQTLLTAQRRKSGWGST